MQNLGQIRFYRSSDKQLVLSWDVSTQLNGTWSIIYNVPSWTYYVVYKGQSHLASYLSGVSITQWTQQTLDFTTGANLYNAQNLSLSENNWYKYQIAGDCYNDLWVYDFEVNGSDIAIVTKNWFINAWVPVLDRRNFNGDDAINGAEISIIGTNFIRRDSFYLGSSFVW
jgi:hypothetical protein